MKKKDYSKTDNRAFIISLHASIITVIIIYIIELILDILNIFNFKITSFLGKIAIIGILIVVYRHFKKDYRMILKQ